MARRASIDFMLPIAILLIVLVGVSTTKTGTLGGVGQKIQKTVGGLFGEEATQCPFLQKGALSSILMGGEEVYTTIGELRLAVSFGEYEGEQGTWITVTNTTSGDDLCTTPWESVVSGNALLSGSTDIATICEQSITCTASLGPCMCTEEDPNGEETGTQQPGGLYPCTLRYWLLTEGMGLNGAAAADAEFGKFASRKMPPLICIAIFGLVPFVVMYYLFQDLMAFMFISPTSKKLIALAMSMFAIVSGAFADLAYVLTKLTGIGTSWSFLFLIFGTGLAAVLITNFMGVTSAASMMHKSLNEAHMGFMMLRSFGKEIEEVSK